MTSSSRSSALKALAAALVAAAAGCGPKDGSADYADGLAAYGARDFKRAVECFGESLKLTPDSADTWLMLARARMELGEVAEAASAHQKAAELAAGDADVVELGAQIAYHSKDFAKARAAYAELARSADAATRSRGWCGLGVIEMAGIAGAGTLAELSAAKARVAFLAAARLDGRNATARYHLGRLYRDTFGYSESALDQFSLFVRLETNDVSRVQNVERRVIPELRDLIAKAAARRPGAERRDSAASAAALKKADEAWAKGNYKTAKLRYADALAADVLSYPAAIGLAKSCEKTDSSSAGLREALKCYKNAAKIRPSSRDALMSAGSLATKLGQHASAVEAFSRAVAARPTDVTAIDGLIRALRKCDRPKAANVYQEYRNGISAPRK